MHFDYDKVDWQFVAGILDENSRRLSRTRGGTIDLATSPAKQGVLVEGQEPARRAADNERRVQRFLFESRHHKAPADGKAVLDLMFHLADLTNAGLVDNPHRYREWPSEPKPPAPPDRRRVDHAKLPEEMDKFAVKVAQRWTELTRDPVPLASWAEWELNGGSLHPFADGCGRISRAFGALLLIRGSWLLPLYQEMDTYFAEGHRGPKEFAAYVRRRISARAAGMGMDKIVHELPLTWEEIEYHLAGLLGFSPPNVKSFYKEDPSQYGWRLFFKVQYRRGEVIIAKNMHSDYAALHLQGLVCVSDDEPSPPAQPKCWDNPRPWRRTRIGRLFARLLPTPRKESVLSQPDTFGGVPPGQPVPGDAKSPWQNAPATGGSSGLRTLRDVADRLMGVTGALWHLPRSKTLRADDDGDEPCVMLLIKRKALEALLTTKAAGKRVPGLLYQQKIQDYLKTTFPDVLSNNRLFRSLLYVEDVLDWDAALRVLSRRGPSNPMAARLLELLPTELRLWMTALRPAQLEDADKYRIVSALNKLLTRDDLDMQAAWGSAGAPTANERSRHNRLLIEAAFPPGTLRTVQNFSPSTPQQFQAFVQTLWQESQDRDLDLAPERYQKAGVIGDWPDQPEVFKQGDPADALYFILSGTFVVTGGDAGTALLNHLPENGFFGESCVEPGAGAVRKASVAVLSYSGYVVNVHRDVVHALGAAYPDFTERLRNEVARSRRRDEGRRTGMRPVPRGLPQSAASRLVLTTNVLLIDMDRCTRCDQCVQGCHDAHHDRPRFHRANPKNPDLRFGKYEVAAACMHCSDAPCLEVCPVGAITFLPGGAVQVHRDRCIGCEKCFNACPFQVIEMLPPVPNDPDDGRSLGKKPNVATKCDLCLTRDSQPPCVVACPYGAAIRARPEAVIEDIKGWAAWADPG